MAYPASTQKLKNALDKVDDTANRIRAMAVDLRNRSSSGPVNRIEISDFLRFLRYAIVDWNAASALPGMVQYVRDQKDNQTIDVVAEFTSMVNAATTLADWIYANIPTGGGGAALEYQRNSNGDVVHLQYTSAQLADFRTNVDTFTATIS